MTNEQAFQSIPSNPENIRALCDIVKEELIRLTNLMPLHAGPISVTLPKDVGLSVKGVVISIVTSIIGQLRTGDGDWHTGERNWCVEPYYTCSDPTVKGISVVF